MLYAVAYKLKFISKKEKESPALTELKLEAYHEGLVAQIMHIGSYDTEAPTLAAVHF